MTKAQEKASEKLAAKLAEATGRRWFVDEACVSGDSAMMSGDSPGGWRRRPTVTRDMWGVVYLRLDGVVRRIGRYTGNGWQKRAAKDAAKWLPIGEVKS